MNKASGLALMLSGGGAHAAYQAGFLSCLARHFPDLQISILTGVSAGAINAVHLANHRGTFAEAVADLITLWRSVTTAQVFRVDPASLAGHVARWGMRLVSGGLPVLPGVRGLVDTAPLRQFLTDALQPVNGELTGIGANLRAGRLQAVAVTTTSYATGKSVTWVQGERIAHWQRPWRSSMQCALTIDHVMGSAALPLFFPAVRIGHQWHGDGGIRQAAPLSPAIHLGAERILAVSTRCQQSQPETEPTSDDDYPPPAQILGLMMDAIFLDALDYDALLLQRINRLVAGLSADERQDLRPVRLFVMRPSCDIGRLAAQFEPQLPRAFRFLLRGLGTREEESADSLSLIMFEPDYLSRLIEQGEADAEKEYERIARLLA